MITIDDASFMTTLASTYDNMIVLMKKKPWLKLLILRDGVRVSMPSMWGCTLEGNLKDGNFTGMEKVPKEKGGRKKRIKINPKLSFGLIMLSTHIVMIIQNLSSNQLLY